MQFNISPRQFIQNTMAFRLTIMFCCFSFGYRFVCYGIFEYTYSQYFLFAHFFLSLFLSLPDSLWSVEYAKRTVA